MTRAGRFGHVIFGKLGKDGETVQAFAGTPGLYPA
jgi:hypothetical protein